MRRIFALLLVLICLSGCTIAPNDAEIKIQVAKTVLKDGGEKIFFFENFRKTNGLMLKDGRYIAEVSYDLVFRKSLEEISNEISQEAQSSPMDAIQSGLTLMSQLLQYGQFKAGDRLTFHKKFTLIDTEQGWRLERDFLDQHTQQ